MADEAGSLKNFKIPKNASEAICNSEPRYNSMANNPYYEYSNQHPSLSWQQTTAYPAYFYGTEKVHSNNANRSEALATSVANIKENIYNTLSKCKERPKNYQRNIFKETVPDLSDETLPKELTVQFQPLFCKLCVAQLSSNVMAKLHYKSKNHEKKVRKFLQEYAERTKTPLHKRAMASASLNEDERDPKWFHCDACDLPLTGRMHAESHYMGKNHQKVIMGHKIPTGYGHYDESGKWVRDAPTKRVLLKDGEDTFGQSFKKQKTNDIEAPTTSNSNEFYCSYCNVNTTCKEQLENHYQGQKHRKKMKALNLTEGPEFEVSKNNQESQKFFCSICQVSTPSEVTLEIHFQGQKHRKKSKLLGIEPDSSLTENENAQQSPSDTI